MTHSALFLSDQTQMKYVKLEIQDLAPFSHLTLISVTFDGFFAEKICESKCDIGNGNIYNISEITLESNILS